MVQPRNTNSKLGYIFIISVEILGWTGLGVWGAYKVYTTLWGKHSEYVVLMLVLILAMSGLSIGIFRVYLMRKNLED